MFHDPIRRGTIRDSLRDACHGDKDLQHKVDHTVGEYFKKEKDAGRISKISDIQEMVKKIAGLLAIALLSVASSGS